MAINVEEIKDRIFEISSKEYDITAINKGVLNNIRTLLFRFFEELMEVDDDYKRFEKDEILSKYIIKVRNRLAGAVLSLLNKYNSEISARNTEQIVKKALEMQQQQPKV